MRAQACVHFEAALYLPHIHIFLYSAPLHFYVSPDLSLCNALSNAAFHFMQLELFCDQASNWPVPAHSFPSLIVRHRSCWFYCVLFDFTSTMRHSLTHCNITNNLYTHNETQCCFANIHINKQLPRQIKYTRLLNNKQQQLNVTSRLGHVCVFCVKLCWYVSTLRAVGVPGVWSCLPAPC